MSGHMQQPVLRLVSLHPSLSLNLSFLRVPEIHDTFAYKCFISRDMSVEEVVNRVQEELGLAGVLVIPGGGAGANASVGGALEYVLEEVWTDGVSESTFRSSSLQMY